MHLEPAAAATAMVIDAPSFGGKKVGKLKRPQNRDQVNERSEAKQSTATMTASQTDTAGRSYYVVEKGSKNTSRINPPLCVEVDETSDI